MVRNCLKYKTAHKKSEKAHMLTQSLFSRVSGFKRYQLHLASLLNYFMALIYFIVPERDRKPLKLLTFRLDLTFFKGRKP